MQNPFKKTTPIDTLLDKVLAKLNDEDPATQDYQNLLTTADKLKKLKASGREQISMNTVIIVFGGLVQVAIIIGYEHFHPIATKALGLLMRPRT